MPASSQGPGTDVLGRHAVVVPAAAKDPTNGRRLYQARASKQDWPNL